MELEESEKALNIGKLPTEILEHIFSSLDVKSLLQCSLVCQNFFELTKSSKISEKMKLSLNFDCEEEKLDEMVELMKSDKENLLRGYKHIEVIKFRDAYLEDDIQETFSDFLLSIGSSLTSLKLFECEMDRDLIVNMFGNLQNLEELTVDSVELEVHGAAMIDEEDTADFPAMKKLRKFHLISSDFFFLMLIGTCDLLHELTIDNPSFSRTDIEKLEDFILKQSELRNLIMKSIRFNSSYSTSRLSNVPFQLSQLELRNVSWDIAEHAEGFLKSQRNLDKLVIYSRNLTFKQFKSMMERNRKLRCLEIGEPLLVDGDSFNALMMPGTLEELRFEWTSDFYAKLLSNSHNLKKLYVHVNSHRNDATSQELIPAINNLKNLDTLELKTSNLEVEKIMLPKLRKVSLELNGITKIIATLHQFFSNHSEIRHVELNIHPVSSEQLSFLPPKIESLTMQNLEIVSEDCVDKIAATIPELKVLRIEDAFDRASSDQNITKKMKKHGIDFKILK